LLSTCYDNDQYLLVPLSKRSRLCYQRTGSKRIMAVLLLLLLLLLFDTLRRLTLVKARRH